MKKQFFLLLFLAVARYIAPFAAYRNLKATQHYLRKILNKVGMKWKVNFLGLTQWKS